MRTRLKFYLLFLGLSLMTNLCVAQSDTSMIYTYKAFIDRVKQFHPIAFQANLKSTEGQARILKAKGNFDPKLAGDIQQKYFDGKEYYSEIDAGLKIPTWFGVTAQAGFDHGRGDFINNEFITPENGLWHAGINVNLGKGLIIDERRAELKQAKIFAQSAEMERQLILNELVYDASIAYWEWFKAYNYLQIYNTALQTSKLRFENVKQLALFGDKPIIDTVEAAMQFQNQIVNYEQGLLDWKNKTQKLEIYLWIDGLVPLELDSAMIPSDFNSINAILLPVSIQLRIDSALVSHPKLLVSQYKIDFMRVENRLNRDALKPLVSLKYNALSAMNQPDLSMNYSINNYNWGATFSYPLFTRKERGIVRLTDVKIQTLESDLINDTQKLRNSIQMALNMNQTTLNQVKVLRQNVASNQLLFDAEQRRYLIGESSLFMVNSRELSLMFAKQKLIEMLTNNVISKHYVDYQLAEPIF